MRLANKVAIITGSGRGIGQEMARMFAAEGAAVMVADIQTESAQQTAAAITAAGGLAHAVQVDIAEQPSVVALIDETLTHFGRLDILINNAGIGSNESFLSMTLEEWNRNLQVNLTGTFLCGQAAARVMVEQRYGKIVNVASISGQRGGQGRAAYGAAKAGVILLTRVMAVELAPYGINVNAISPGPVDTDQSRGTHTPATRRAYHERLPVGRYGERCEVAAAALFLSSDEASFVHGHVLNVDGGFQAAGLMFNDSQEDLTRSEQYPRPSAELSAHAGPCSLTDQLGTSKSLGTP
jgi:3-oxoacyl-[acyl-carrier protein] reductase